jgi:hypothetical protein
MFFIDGIGDSFLALTGVTFGTEPLGSAIGGYYFMLM